MIDDARKIVCITGGDGCGKSTQIEKLCPRIEAEANVKVAAVTIWDPLRDPSMREATLFRDPREIDRYLSHLEPKGRTLFLYHSLCHAIALAERREPDVLLMNGYWYKYFATELAYGGSAAELRPLSVIFPRLAFSSCA